MMRSVLVVLAMIPMATRAADLSVGTFEVSGGSNFVFESSSNDFTDSLGQTTTTDTRTFGLDVTGLYYVIPNFGVGLGLAYQNSEDESGGVTFGSSTLLIGPAAGFAFPIQDNLSLAVQGQLGYVTATFTETGSPDQDASGFGFGLGAGLKFFLAKSFSLDAGLGYNYTKVTYDTPFGSKPENTNSGFGLNVGFSVYFGR